MALPSSAVEGLRVGKVKEGKCLADQYQSSRLNCIWPAMHIKMI